MRIVSLATFVAAAIAFALPASALTVETQFAPDFQQKLERKLGPSEASVLTTILEGRINAAFASQGVQAERVVVTIVDAEPNHPTVAQVKHFGVIDRTHTISSGGAKVSGIAYDASGNEIGRMDYNWYATTMLVAIRPTTWNDAATSFDKFARRLANKLS